MCRVRAYIITGQLTTFVRISVLAFNKENLESRKKNKDTHQSKHGIRKKSYQKLPVQKKKIKIKMRE